MKGYCRRCKLVRHLERALLVVWRKGSQVSEQNDNHLWLVNKPDITVPSWNKRRIAKWRSRQWSRRNRTHKRARQRLIAFYDLQSWAEEHRAEQSKAEL